MIMPKHFDQRPSIGPQRFIAGPSTDVDHAIANMTEGQNAIDRAWDTLLPTLESTWCYIHDAVDSDGQPLQSHCGRGNGLETKMRPLIPPRHRLYGAMDTMSRARHMLSDRLAEWAQCLRALSANSTKRGLATQEAAVRAALRQPAGWVQQYLCENAEVAKRLNQILTSEASLIELATRASELRARLLREARQAAQAKGTERHAAYQRWQDEQLRSGAAALHRLVKAQPEAPERPVKASEDWTLGLEAILNVDKAFWQDLWERHPSSTAPWRTADISSEPPLPAITGAALRDSAKSFAWGKSFWCISVKWFLQRPDEHLDRVASFLNGIEDVGLWPAVVRHALLHLIPKTDGGRRPIGLIHGLCKLW